MTPAEVLAAFEKEVQKVPDFPPGYLSGFFDRNREKLIGILSAIQAKQRRPSAPAEASSAPARRPAHIPATLRGLDNEQLAAAVTDGRVLVAASAGSGKTYVLTRRIVYLIKERRVLPQRILALAFNRRAAREIIDRLAAELLTKEQLEDLWIGTLHSTFGRLAAEFASPRERDAIRVNLIKAPGLLYWYMARLWSECRQDPPPRRMANLIQSWAGENLTPAQAAEHAIGEAERRGAIWYEWYLGFKGALDGARRWAPPCTDDRSQRIWREFLQRFRGGGGKRLGDFTDMILLMREVLQNPAVQRELSGRWEHVLVDEAQDLNAVEHEILGALTSTIDAGRGQSFWLVGDEKQSINYFVGARPDLFTRWAAPDSGFVVRPITTNYRCTPEIVELSNRLMLRHPLVLKQPSRPAPGKQRGTGVISLSRPQTHYAGAVETMQRIRHLLSEQARPADFAILARTNLELAAFETAALLLTIPYSRRNSQPFLQSPEARVVIAYLMIATGEPAEKQEAALAIALDRPARLFLREQHALTAVADARKRFAERHDQLPESIEPYLLLEESDHASLVAALHALPSWQAWKDAEALKELELLYRAVATMREIARSAPAEGQSDRRTHEVLNLILEVEGAPPKKGAPRTRLRDVLVPWASNDEDAAEPDGEETEAGLGNVEFFYMLANGKDDEGRSLQDPVAFIHHLLQLRDQAGDLSFDAAAWEKQQLELPIKERQPVPAVILATVHSVKGAQWKDVTVVMAGGVFPFPPKTPAGELSEAEQEALKKRHEDEYNTERQLAYVALTRGAERLYVLAPLQNAYGRAAQLSEFIVDSILSSEEIPDAFSADPDEAFLAGLPAGDVPLSRSAEEFLAPPEQMPSGAAPGAAPEPSKDAEDAAASTGRFAPPADSTLSDDELLIKHGVTIQQTMTTPTNPKKKPRPVWNIRGGPRALYDELREQGAKSFRGVVSAWSDPKEIIVEFLRSRSGPETPLEDMQSRAVRAQARAERREDRAEKWEKAARAAREASDRAVDGIPPGQPILVGHHSERRHRAALERSHRKMGQYFEAAEKANWLSRRAAHDREVAELLLSGPRLTVVLSALQPSSEGEDTVVEEVPTLMDAASRVLEFLDERNLRPTQWGGAVVSANGVTLAEISPDGQVFHPAPDLGGEPEAFTAEELEAPIPDRLLLTIQVRRAPANTAAAAYLLPPEEREVASLNDAVETVKTYVTEHSLERPSFPGALVKAANQPVAWIDYAGDVFTTDEAGQPTTTPIEPSRWRPPSGPIGKFSTTYAWNRQQEAEAEQRRLERELERLPDTDSQAVRNRRLWLQGEIERQRTKANYWTQEIHAAGGIKYGKHNIQKGDFVGYRGSWYPVVRANEKTVTLGNWLDIPKFTYPVPWAEIRQAMDAQRRRILPGQGRTVEATPHEDNGELAAMAEKVTESREAPNRNPERALEFLTRRIEIAQKHGHAAANIPDEIERSIPRTMYPKGRERLIKYLRYGTYANETENVKQALLRAPEAEQLLNLIALLDEVPSGSRSEELRQVVRQWADDIESRKAGERASAPMPLPTSQEESHPSPGGARVAAQPEPEGTKRPNAWESIKDWLADWRRLYQQPATAESRRRLQEHLRLIPERAIISASPDELVALEGIAAQQAASLDESHQSWAVRVRELIQATQERLARKNRAGRECPPNIPGCALGVLGAECGIATTVLTKSADGDLGKRPARYCLADVRALIPSHATPSAVRRAEQMEPYSPPTPVASFSARRDYPAQVQERRYDRAQEELKVTRNAQRFEPSEIWNNVTNPTTGPPIVTAQGWVLGGNGRTMILDEYYNAVSDPQEKAERVQAAKEYLWQHAALFGFQPDEISEVAEPTVVRVVDTQAGRRGATATDLKPEERAELVRLVRDYNISLQQNIDPMSLATAAARLLPDSALDYLAQNLADQSLAEYLGSRESEPFLRTLGRSVVNLEDPNLFDGGRLTEQGKELIERLLTSRLLPDPDFVEKLGLGLRRTVAQMAPYLLAAAAATKEFDLGESLNLALRELMTFRHSGYDKLEDYLRTPPLLAQDREERAALKQSLHGEELLRVLDQYGNSYRKLANFARRYASHAIAQNSIQGMLLASERLPEPQAFQDALTYLEKSK